jgi:hypothetical protein
VLSHRKPHPNVPEALDSEDHVLKVNMTVKPASSPH